MTKSALTTHCLVFHQQVLSLQTQLVGACSRAERAEEQQQATATASAVALSRAQHQLEDAQAAQFVAEEAHKTADAAAKLLAQRITGEVRVECMTTHADPLSAMAPLIGLAAARCAGSCWSMSTSVYKSVGLPQLAEGVCHVQD